MIPLVNLFPTSSGEEEDRWRIKTEEKQGKKTEEELEPLISLALGIGGSTKSDEREKDNIFGRIVMVKEENKEVDDHNQAVVEREGCRINSVVRFTEDQMIDPEPGRCRRTDGKKWRCHQPVISNEKYCEKHMHRGSNRSRKLVEACPYSRTTNLKNLNKNINLNKDIRPRFSENLGPKEPTKVVKRAQDLGTSTAVSYGNNKQSNKAKCVVAKDRIAVINQTSGLDFSPKSVLLNDTGMRCPSVQSCKSNTESESRCKRTDGKKWQCKKEVLPYQKYCAQHVNRGRFRSKKRPIGSSSSREIQAAYGSTSSPKIYGTGQATVGLGLKISLPTRLDDPRNIIKGNMSQNGGSSSSTEATESDGSTDVSDIIVLSP
uniref:Growth-regulating factor n=1 Tax=Chenopodium quinoa TaxID=63459 RepID=A0A803LI15_CHEQI